MTEKRLSRLALGVVLWFVVATPYLIPFPGLPKGDLTVDTGTRGVIPAETGRAPTNQPRLNEPSTEMRSKQVMLQSESRIASATGGICNEREGSLKELKSSTAPLSAVPLEPTRIRGILIEGGKRTEIVWPLTHGGGRDPEVRAEPRSKSPTSEKTLGRTAERDGISKGLEKILSEDLFEISSHWNETDFSGPNDVGDLIQILEGYGN
ncbi:MAG: hypothetical protein H6751_17315 [Candidatus Omnitrophica bacterium]|nr:hypothetical protein [Candidatus Omnitrophota bacterium]MCB9784730.1 hypothetical protein [Candidatus Omnitrophota bacterium]